MSEQKGEDTTVEGERCRKNSEPQVEDKVLDASEISAMFERRRSYILSNRIIVNPHRVTFGQPRNVKVLFSLSSYSSFWVPLHFTLKAL